MLNASKTTKNETISTTLRMFWNRGYAIHCRSHISNTVDIDYIPPKS